MVDGKGRVIKWSSCMTQFEFFLDSFCEAIFVNGRGFIIFGEGVSKYTAETYVKPKFETSNYAGDQTLVGMVAEEVFETQNINIFIYNPRWERVLRT